MPVRIMSATVQYVLTEFNERQEPINEFVSQPIRVFRVVHPDIWQFGDAQAFPKAVPPAHDEPPTV